MRGPHIDECIYAYDAHGNVTDLVAHYAYDAFGQATAQADTLADANPYRFSTNHPDNKVHLYYYGLRSYSPELGRWISRDPAGDPLDKEFELLRHRSE